MAHLPRLRAILDAADCRIEEGAGIGHEEFWNRVESTKRSRETNGRAKKRRTKRRTK